MEARKRQQDHYLRKGNLEVRVTGELFRYLEEKKEEETSFLRVVSAQVTSERIHPHPLRWASSDHQRRGRWGLGYPVGAQLGPESLGMSPVKSLAYSVACSFLFTVHSYRAVCPLMRV